MLIHNRTNYLIVRPRQPLLPGSGQEIPGIVINVPSGNQVVESQLRRAVLSQVGLAVGDLRLVGSHAGRGVEQGYADARLNLIFGSEYCSGIMTPNSTDLIDADWLPRQLLLMQPSTAGWLQSCIREYEILLPPSKDTGIQTGFSGFKFGRKRS